MSTQYQATLCDDGTWMVHTEGDVIAYAAQRDPKDKARLIAAALNAQKSAVPEPVRDAQCTLTSSEPIAWAVERLGDKTFPHFYRKKSEAEAMVAYVTNGPRATMRPLFAHPAQGEPEPSIDDQSYADLRASGGIFPEFYAAATAASPVAWQAEWDEGGEHVRQFYPDEETARRVKWNVASYRVGVTDPVKVTPLYAHPAAQCAPQPSGEQMAPPSLQELARDFKGNVND